MQSITIGPVAIPLYAVERKVPINAEIPATQAAIHNTHLRSLEC